MVNCMKSLKLLSDLLPLPGPVGLAVLDAFLALDTGLGPLPSQLLCSPLVGDLVED